MKHFQFFALTLLAIITICTAEKVEAQWAYTHTPSTVVIDDDVDGLTFYNIQDNSDTNFQSIDMFDEMEKTTDTDEKGIEPIVRNFLKLSPNPIYSFASVEFEMPKDGFAKLVILDLKGKEIEVLELDYFNKDVYQRRISASKLPKGVYFISLITEDYMETRKLIVAR